MSVNLDFLIEIHVPYVRIMHDLAKSHKEYRDPNESHTEGKTLRLQLLSDLISWQESFVG